ncbi:MAG: DNA-3-methyladenine glycosylase [Candidatus Binatia bacterium]
MQKLRESLADAIRAAPALLGCTITSRGRGRPLRALIVETEAYCEDDPASHAFGGPNERNRSMFGPPGSAYVYRIHRSLCFNVVTGPEGSGQAVLIRAVQPLEGLDHMMRARGRATVGSKPPRGYAISNGPGKLCQALGITLEDDGCDLLADPRFLAGGRHERRHLLLTPRRWRPEVVRSRRVGISRAREELFRFAIAGNPWVSR